MCGSAAAGLLLSSVTAGASFSPCKVPGVPKLLLPAYQLQCASDSGRLFIASDRGSVHVVQLLGLGARDAAGLPHCQQLSCPLTGCVGGEVTLGQDSSASTQVVFVTVPCEPQLSLSPRKRTALWWAPRRGPPTSSSCCR